MEFEIDISRRFCWQGKITEKIQQLMLMFGIDIERLKNNSPCHKCKLKISKGDIVYLTGASGSGKSVLFKEIYHYFSQNLKLNTINIDNIKLPIDKAVIDCIKANLIDSLQLLSKAGLSDVFNILNYPALLSDGQKYRFKLASAIADKADFVFADEFCSNLDRLTAATVAYKIARFARASGKTLILSSSHDDIISEISPDIIVIKHTSMPTEVIYKQSRKPTANSLH